MRWRDQPSQSVSIESLGPSRRLVSRKQGTSRTNLNNFYIRFPPSLRVVEKLLNCPRPSHATSLSTPQVLVLVPLCTLWALYTGSDLHWNSNWPPHFSYQIYEENEKYRTRTGEPSTGSSANKYTPRIWLGWISMPIALLVNWIGVAERGQRVCRRK